MLLGHVSRFHQSRERGDIWWIIEGKYYRCLFKISRFCFSEIFFRRPLCAADHGFFNIIIHPLILVAPSRLEKYQTLSWLGEYNRYIFPTARWLLFGFEALFFKMRTSFLFQFSIRETGRFELYRVSCLLLVAVMSTASPAWIVRSNRWTHKSQPIWLKCCKKDLNCNF